MGNSEDRQPEPEQQDAEVHPPPRRRESRLRKALKTAFLIAVLVCLGLGLAEKSFRNLDAKARPFAASLIQHTVATWNPELIEKHSDPDLASAITADEWRRMFANYSQKLGPVNRLGEIGSSYWVNYSFTSGTVVSGRFDAPVMFEKVKAGISLFVRQQGDSWNVTGFEVTSNLLIR